MADTGVAEAEGVRKQLSVQQLATISDAALDNAYHYGRSTPGNTFGWQANLKSAAYAKQMIDQGITNIEKISDAIHKGWNVTAQAFVKNPMMFDDSKTMAPEKLQAKVAQRQKLMTQQYDQLPEEEKEKDRVVARAMLQAIKGDLNEKSTSQAQFRTMAAAAHDPAFARKVGIKPSVAREFNQADRGQDYKSLPTKADESKKAPAEKEADYGDDYQAMVQRVKRLAGLGPLKTQYDPQKRVYRNMPTAVQPKK
jgi:hypothetical protein